MSRPFPSFPDWASPRIFPAIDLRGGGCVRLIRGARDAELRYDGDPVEVALRWEAAGAECLHVVDLGGAFGEPHSRAVILRIAEALKVPVQAGGGLRDEAAVGELLDGGVARVLIGTRALEDRSFLERLVADRGAGRVVVSVDCEGDSVRVAGWERGSPLGLAEALSRVTEAGIEHLLVTATDRDGTLAGPRLELYERVLALSSCRVVAAGGIGNLKHIREALRLPAARLEGVVVGRALYEGTVRLEEAIALTSTPGGSPK